MAEDWSSLDLHLPSGPLPGRRAGLEHALREAVRDGRLAPGTPLPSSRALARDLQVSRGTVTQAYDQLVAEGYLASKPRSGIRVADRPAPPPSPAAAPPSTTLMPVRGSDLRSGLPDLSAFPRREWLAAARQVMQSAPNTVFGYGDPAGDLSLREALAEYLGRARGVVATADRVFVCAGYTHALPLICRAFGGGTIAFEDPGEPAYCRLAEQAGLAVSRVPVDSDGLVVSRLGSEALVVVTPAHQYPVGVTLSPSRRTELLSWARAHDAYVIEDDYDGEFRYDRQPVGALQGLAPDRVVYAGTASKTVAPGLRLAWIVVPPDLVPLMRAAAAVRRAGPPPAPLPNPLPPPPRPPGRGDRVVGPPGPAVGRGGGPARGAGTADVPLAGTGTGDPPERPRRGGGRHRPVLRRPVHRPDGPTDRLRLPTGTRVRPRVVVAGHGPAGGPTWLGHRPRRKAKVSVTVVTSTPAIINPAIRPRRATRRYSGWSRQAGSCADGMSAGSLPIQRSGSESTAEPTAENHRMPRGSCAKAAGPNNTTLANTTRFAHGRRRAGGIIHASTTTKRPHPAAAQIQKSHVGTAPRSMERTAGTLQPTALHHHVRWARS
jgi:GntR family transcriptional regulator / MocR family aminotransferase